MWAGHPTSVALDPSGRFVYVTCFDTSTNFRVSTDPRTGTLAPLPGSPFATEPGPQQITVVH
jgi:hypothetical protein